MRRYYVWVTTCFLVDAKSEKDAYYGKWHKFEQRNNFSLGEISENIIDVEELSPDEGVEFND